MGLTLVFVAKHARVHEFMNDYMLICYLQGNRGFTISFPLRPFLEISQFIGVEEHWAKYNGPTPP
jgi:hypothetical protein